MDSVGIKLRERPLSRCKQRRSHVGFRTKDESLSKDTLEGIFCGDVKKHKWPEKM